MTHIGRLDVGASWKRKGSVPNKAGVEESGFGLSPGHIGVLVALRQLEVREPTMALSVHGFNPWPSPQLSRWSKEQGHRVCGKQDPEGPSLLHAPQP